MKVRVMFVLILSVFMLQGCNSGCSQEDMVAKAQRISERMQQLATDDPKSMLEISSRWRQITSDTADSDTGEICAAYDDFLAELN